MEAHAQTYGCVECTHLQHGASAAKLQPRSPAATGPPPPAPTQSTIGAPCTPAEAELGTSQRLLGQRGDLLTCPSAPHLARRRRW